MPSSTNQRLFDKAYVLATEAIAGGNDVKKNGFLMENFYGVVVDSFRMKCQAGLDVINYPQHYDMHEQFRHAIHKATDKGTYVVNEKDAIIPEVHVIKEQAKRFYEEMGNRVSLRVCITGPMELYLKEVGVTVYEDILLMLAKTVKLFATNSILNSKYVKTEIVALDEPSFGLSDLDVNPDALVEVLEKSLDFGGAQKHIHLHSSSRASDVMNVENLDVLSFEYAASPRNIESVSKRDLERADKKIRVGISRTDIDSIFAELHDRGISKPSVEQLVDNRRVIYKRFCAAKERFGEVMTFTGPDCGLGSWPTQEAAQLLLKRTVNVVRTAVD